MLASITQKEYYQLFLSDPHPYISQGFIKQNTSKCDSLLFLASSVTKSKMGLVVGIKNGKLYSPFSAPFGGFHFQNELIYSSEVDSFIKSLTDYCTANKTVLNLTLPPNLYHQTFNSKVISSLFRNGAILHIPEITNIINLQQFTGTFSQTESRRCLKKANEQGLKFLIAQTSEEKIRCFTIIKENRNNNNRPLHMALEDIIALESLFPVDFFLVTKDNQDIGAAIFYRGHSAIVQAIFWGDIKNGRDFFTMDFLVHQLWSHYKVLEFTAIDLGISTENGIPNNGLLRFKETHEAQSSLRLSFQIGSL